MAMQEKEVFDDVLTSQKFITETYNTYANECATPDIRDEFMNILNEEHQIQADVFDEMKKRGCIRRRRHSSRKFSRQSKNFKNANPQS